MVRHGASRLQFKKMARAPSPRLPPISNRDPCFALTMQAISGQEPLAFVHVVVTCSRSCRPGQGAPRSLFQVRVWVDFATKCRTIQSHNSMFTTSGLRHDDRLAKLKCFSSQGNMTLITSHDVIIVETYRFSDFFDLIYCV